MYTISDRQIDFILCDIEARGITMKDLQYNLLDHICIIIEQNLEEGGDFARFYATVIETFYQHELREIQEAALFLAVRKNNHVMKKAMISSGAFAVAAFIGGCFGKVFHSHLTDFLLFTGFTSFVLLFLPLVFMVKIKELKAKRDTIIFTSGSLAGLLYGFCMLLKFLAPRWPAFLGPQWPQMDMIWLVLWLLAMAIALLVFIPAYFLAGMHRPGRRMNTIVTSLLLVAFTAMQFAFTNLGPLRTAQKQTLSTSNKSVTVQVKAGV